MNSALSDTYSQSLISNRRLYIFGALTWLIPFIVSLPFFSAEGELTIDPFLFKTIMMIVLGGIGTALMVRMFRFVGQRYLMAGLTIGFVWFAINFGLDLIVLVGLLGNDSTEWLIQTGLRYLIIPITGVAIGKGIENALGSRQ
ncbi:MAG: hypothetical protein AAF633_26120 [Chloroflexota bacterium]